MEKEQGKELASQRAGFLMREMIYRQCGRCGRRIPSGTTCKCNDMDKRSYAKPEGIRKGYHTQRWKNLRRYVIAKYNGIDIYMLYRHGKAIPADTVHHIEPAGEKPDLFYSDGNLIPVSRQSHEEVHKRYKQEHRADVVEELRRYKKQFEEDGGIKKVFE